MSFFRTQRAQLLRGALCDEDNLHCDYRSFVRLGFNRGVSTVKLVETIPDPPTITALVRGDGSVTITFIPPRNTGNSIITSYIITYSPGNFTTTVATSPATISGLTNGTTYRFTAVAVNKIGQSASSSLSDPIIVATIPGVPRTVSAVAYDGHAVVSWRAPLYDGGLTVRSYELTVNSSAGTYVISDITSIIFDVTELVNGLSYTFRVRAKNDVGAGDWSSYSSAVIPKATLAGSLFFDPLHTTPYMELTPGFVFSTGSYSIETWFYSLGAFANTILLSPPGAGTNNGLGLFIQDNTHVAIGHNKQADTVYTVNEITTNAWHHIAVCRNASDIETVFIDGVKAIDSSGNGTQNNGPQQTNNFNYTGTTLLIGTGPAEFAKWNGYLTNMRIVIGATAYNPTAASISTPTGPLAGIANTKYLMLCDTPPPAEIANGKDAINYDIVGIQTINEIDITVSTTEKPF
jgi:hypothetical protein